MSRSRELLEQLDQVPPSTFADDARPGWAGVATLFGQPLVPLGPVAAGRHVALGAPFDGTASSRPGAAEGPQAIRRASLVFSSYLDSLGEHEMMDMRTGHAFRYRKADVVDAGDLHVYPTDTKRTFLAIASEVAWVTSEGATPVIMGGDHSIGFPTFAGVRKALIARQPGARLGLVQLDHHFDFGDFSVIHGPLYHGSNARRISEIDGVRPDQMAFVGVGNVTRKGQLAGLLDAGSHVVPGRELRTGSIDKVLAPTVEALSKSCSHVYLSIDIDVLDAAYAPGTGHVTVGGIGSDHLLDALFALRALPLAGIEIVEVSPRYDATGRTAQLAAQLLFELLFRA